MMNSLYLFISPVVPNSRPAANGQSYYNTTSNKVSVYINGAWDNLATESYVNGQIRTGNYIYVDVNNPNAADTRGTLNKYALSRPFITIQAAWLASSGAVTGGSDKHHF